MLQAALEKQFETKTTDYDGVDLAGPLLLFVVSTEGAFHPHAAAALEKLRNFKHGHAARRYELLISCALLATTKPSTTTSSSSTVTWKSRGQRCKQENINEESLFRYV